MGANIVTNTREMAADDYFQGMFTTAVGEGDIITALRPPIPKRATYAKFMQPASRFALTAVFVAKFADGVRVAVTGASESGVFRWTEWTQWTKAEAALAGLSCPADGMIADLHDTAAYCVHLVSVVTTRAVAAA